MLAPPSDDDEGIDYELLSLVERQELDNLRSSAIHRYLNKFTLVCVDRLLYLLRITT